MKRVRFTKTEIEALISLCAYAAAGDHEDIGFGHWDKMTEQDKAIYNAIFTADTKLRIMRGDTRCRYEDTKK